MVLNDILKYDKISIYQLLNYNKLISIFFLNLFIITGIHWLIPVPTYPFLMVSQYIGILCMVMIILLIIKPNYNIKIPNFTKKIFLDLQKVKKDYFNKYNGIINKNNTINNNTINNNTKYYITLFIVFLLSIFVLIPINDVIPASMICAVLFFYFKGDDKKYNIAIVLSIIMILFYSFFIKKIIDTTLYIKNNYKNYIHLILILLLIIIIYICETIKKIGYFNKYIIVPENFKFMDIFK